MSFLNLMRNKLKPKEVNDALSEVSGDVSDLETVVSGILPKIPKDYSTDETATGVKWIDGKDIYMKVLTGNTPSEGTEDISLSYDTFITFVGNVKNTQSNNYFDFSRNVICVGKGDKSGIIIQAPTQTYYQNAPYILIIYYTKPDPEPEPTEAKKRTKKTN